MSNGSWERRLYEVHPLALAMREVESTYGDKVSPYEKGKSLLKFGRNSDMTLDTLETIWELGGNETYVPFDGTNPIDKASSSNSGDNAVIRYEYHTQAGTGANTEFTFGIGQFTLNGQAKVDLPVACARVSRAYVVSGTLNGDLYIYEDGSLTAGVPQDLTTVHITILGSLGQTQSYKAATTFSNTDYFIATGGFVSVNRKQAGGVDFQLQVRQVNSVFRPVARIALESSAQDTVQISFLPYAIVPRNADIRVVGVSSASGVEADAAIQGYLASVI